jgi:hypothetical protein
MRTLIIAALLATALLTPAMAQERPSSTQLEEFIGQYDLQDGRVLNVSQRGHALVAQVDGQAAVTLKPAGPGRFVARDGRVRVAFDQHRNGNVTGVAVDIAPAPVQQASR